VEVVVGFEPLVVRMKMDGEDQVVLNGQGLLHMEHFREKVESKDGGIPIAEGEEAQEFIQFPQNSWFEGDTEDGFWEETWGSWTDTKPKGVLADSVRRVPELTSTQVPSLFPSISTSLVTATSMVSHSMLPIWISRQPEAKELCSTIHTASTTTTSTNTPLQLRGCRCTDRFL
jgi:hypothetical protein